MTRPALTVGVDGEFLLLDPISGRFRPPRAGLRRHISRAQAGRHLLQGRSRRADLTGILEQVVASGGHLWACRTSADMRHLKKADLRDEVAGIITAPDFIEKTDGAQLLFI